MSLVTLSTSSGHIVDLSLDSECINAIENVVTAYENFIGCSERSRDDYFFAINELYTKLYYNPDTHMHRALYLTEAEKILADGGRIKWHIFARCRLNRLAKDYVGAFERFNDTLSSAASRVSTISSDLFRLERAHYAFADQYCKELKAVEKYQRLASWAFDVITL